MVSLGYLRLCFTYLYGGFMKKFAILFLFMCFIGASVFAAGASDEGTEAGSGIKTPIERYNPGFVFPTERIQLDYWHVLGTREGFHELVREMADEYESIHPNVTINIRDVPNAQQRAIFTTAFEANTAADVVWIEAQLGLLHDGLLPAPDWAVKMMEETFTDYALSLSKVDGTYYGWSGAEVDVGQMLYYRKDLFREAGLDPENPPTTLEEMLEAAKALTKFDSSGNMTQAGIALRYAGGPQGIGDKFSKYAAAFMDTQSEFFYNADYSDVMFDSEAWIAAAQFYQDLIFKDKVSNTTLPTPINAFAQGLAAMTNRESFFAGWLASNAPDAEYGIAPMVNGDYETGAMPWLAFQGVTVNAENPDVAWDFNMFLVEPQNELQIVKNNGGMSRYKQFQDDPYFKTLPYYDVYVDSITNRPIVRNPYLDPNSLVAEWETKVGEIAVELLTNPDADARELMTELAEFGRNRLSEVR